jgi:hypothetical protein
MEPLGIGLLTALIVYYLVGLVAFYRLRDFEFVRKRQPLVVLLMGVSGAVVGVQYFVNIAENYHLGAKTSCNVMIAVSNLFCPVWLFASFLRCAHLASVYTEQQKHLLQNSSSTTPHPCRSFTEEALTPMREGSWLSRQVQSVAISLLTKLSRLLRVSERSFARLFSTPPEPSPENSGTPTVEKLSESAVRITSRSVPILLGWVLLFHVLYVVAIVNIDIWVLNHPIQRVGCSFFDYLLVYIDSTLFILLYPLFVISIWNCDDKVFIRREIHITFGVFCLSFLLHIYFQFIHKPHVSFFANRGVDPLIFLLIGSIIVVAITIYAPLCQLFYRAFMVSYPTIECSLDHLEIVLDHPILFTKLRRIAAKQLVLENIQFIQDMRQSRFDTLNPLYFYQLYIAADSPLELNLPYEIRITIDNAKNANNLTMEYFLTAETYIKNLVVFNTLFELSRTINLEKVQTFAHNRDLQSLGQELDTELSSRDTIT